MVNVTLATISKTWAQDQMDMKIYCVLVHSSKLSRSIIDASKPNTAVNTTMSAFMLIITVFLSSTRIQG